MLFGLRRCRISTEFFDLTNTMRRLWQEHIGWTRLAINSLVDQSLDTEYVLERLLRNPDDFAEFLEPFYGKKKAKEFNWLLTEHLEIAPDVIDAAKKGDPKAVGEAEKRWYDNAKEIAEFLSSINPYISEKEFQAMFNEHLAIIEAAAVYRINGNYQRQIKMFDLIEIQGIDMADLLTNAIAEQFSDHFECR